MATENYRKSFLEELMFSDFDRIEPTKKNKSVHFSNDGISSHLASESLGIKKDMKKTKKSEWLGLVNDELEEDFIAKQKDDETDSWLNLKKEISRKKAMEDKQQLIKETNIGYEDNKEQGKTEDKENKILGEKMETEDPLIIKAKLSAMEIEKNYLISMMEQMKVNHENELISIRNMQERQLTMTTELFEQQRKIIIEENDRRLNEITNQLKQVELEKEGLRERFTGRLNDVEEKFHSQMTKMKEHQEDNLKYLRNEYESEIERIKTFKNQELEMITSFSNYGKSLDSLLNQWKANIEKLDLLAKSFMTNQDQTIQTKLTDLDKRSISLKVIEENWTSIKDSMQKEKDNIDEIKSSFKSVLDQQKYLIEDDKKQLIKEKSLLENERKNFENEKKEAEINLIAKNEILSAEEKRIREERCRLEERKAEIDEREKQITLKEIDFKYEMNIEKEKAVRIRMEMEEERRIVQKERSTLHENYNSLKDEQHKLENKKIIFDNERDKLRELATKVLQRTEDLENLGSTIVKEKEINIQVLNETKKLNNSLDERSIQLEARMKELNREEVKLEANKAKLKDEWQLYHHLKSSLVCNLCGNGLNRVNYQLKESPIFPNIGHGYSNIEDNDRALLIWQIIAQQDAALLAEETAFVDKLKRN